MIDLNSSTEGFSHMISAFHSLTFRTCTLPIKSCGVKATLLLVASDRSTLGMVLLQRKVTWMLVTTATPQFLKWAMSTSENNQHCTAVAHCWIVLQWHIVSLLMSTRNYFCKLSGEAETPCNGATHGSSDGSMWTCDDGMLVLLLPPRLWKCVCMCADCRIHHSNAHWSPKHYINNMLEFHVACWSASVAATVRQHSIGNWLFINI